MGDSAIVFTWGNNRGTVVTRCHGLVLRALTDAPGPCFVKHAGVAQDTAARERLRAEAQALAQLGDCGALLKPLHSGLIATPWGDGIAFAHRPLEPLHCSARVPLREILRQACAIVRAVTALHAQGVTHADLQPQSILLGHDDAVLTDFVVGESKQLAPEALAYMAPERTGRLAYAVDARADLYSLGALLFHMLCGRPPFEATEALGYVHHHVASTPPLVCTYRQDAPDVLCDIVARLLRKDPETRYQSAVGLLADLTRCARACDDDAHIEPFVLAQEDVVGELRIPERLYGRDSALARIASTLQSAAEQQQIRGLWIAGNAGIGKSSLVRHATDARIRQGHGMRMTGKCDPLKRTMPYLPFMEAIVAWTRALQGCSDDVQAATLTRIKDAVGDDLVLLCELIPALAQLLPSHTAITVIAERERRLGRALYALIVAMPTRDSPLVMFLDDLQWADLATLELIETLLQSSTESALCLLLAYRDEEVGAAHPVAAVQKRTQLPYLHLQPIQEDAVAEWLRDMLHREPDVLRPLAHRVHTKTAGNPFYVLEFVRRLHRDKLLHFDNEHTQWRWRIEDIDRAPIGDNLAELVRARLTRLDRTTQDCMAVAACLGCNFELALVGSACDVKPSQLAAVIDVALREELVVPHGEHGDGQVFAFSHDKVTEAAYALRDAAWRATCHGQLGTQLLARYRAQPTSPALFEAVNQLNRAGALRQTAPWAKDLAELNLAAALHTRASAAFAEARVYYEEAMSALAADAWTSAHTRKFDVCTGLAECRFLTGDIEGGQSLCDESMAFAMSSSERVYVQRVLIRHLRAVNDIPRALALCEQALSDAGVKRLQGDRKAALDSVRARLQSLLNGRQPYDLLQGPLMADDHHRATLQLIADCAPVLRVTNSAYFDAAAVHGLELSITYGNAPESCLAYSTWGALLAAYFDAYDEAYVYADVALRWAETCQVPDFIAMMRFLMALHFNHWRHPLSTTPECMERAMAAAQHADNPFFLGNNVAISSWLRFEGGSTLPATEAHTNFLLAHADEFRAGHWRTLLRVVLRFCQSLQGIEQADKETWNSSVDAAIETMQAASHGPGITVLRLLSAIHAITQEAFDQAWQLLESVRPSAGTLGSSALRATFVCLQGYVAARLMETGDAGYKQVLAQSVERFNVWRHVVPENFEARATLLEGLLRASEEGGKAEGLARLEASIESAARSKQPWIGVLAAQAAAALARRSNIHMAAQRYDTEAVRFAQVLGAHAWAAKLQRRFGVEGEQVVIGTGQGLHALDGLSVVKASQTISSEMELSTLLKTLLPVVIESVGAERGELLLYSDDVLCVEVSARLGAPAELSHQPVSQAAHKIPTSVVNYVGNTEETVVFDQRVLNPLFGADPYLRKRSVCSVMCAPVTRQGRRMGVLYLENRLVNGAFGDARRQVLELLLGQIAISLDASRLFQASQRAVRVRDEFLSVASHELKTPITALRLQVEGLVRLLQRRALADVPQARLDKTMRTAVNQIGRISTLIDELLDVARISSDKLDLRPTPMDLSEMVRDVIDRSEAQLRNARCEVTVQAQPAPGLWDRSRLERVFTNLLQNAMKFGAGKPIDVRVGRAGDAAELSVRDHGIGIAPHDQRRIFERFTRVESSVNVGGLGLGLFVSHQIVQAHHGRIDVESGEGQGARFRVVLPGEPGAVGSQ